MEFLEAPSISCAKRRLVYPVIKWLSKEKFIEYFGLAKKFPASLDYQIQPNILDPLNEDEAGSLSERSVFIGKSIPTLDEGVRWWRGDERLELIGSVVHNMTTNDWELHIPHESGVHIVRKDFLVLCFPDSNSFYWQTTVRNQIPENALRGSVENDVSEYMYIGRNRRGDQDTTGYYFNGRWTKFAEVNETPIGYGKVHVGHECLYVPLADREVKFTEYDILCLRPSPAPLRSLSSQTVRRLVGYSQEKLASINNNKSGQMYLPQSLVDSLLKFPSFLRVGDYMLKDEKVVSEDGRFELLIKDNGELICRSILHTTEDMSREAKQEEQDTQIVRIIRYSVNSIWLHRFKLVFSLDNHRVHIYKSFYNKSPEYRLTVPSGQDKPTVSVITPNDTHSPSDANQTASEDSGDDSDDEFY